MRWRLIRSIGDLPRPRLGFLYLQGRGTRKDLAEAVRWLGLASEHDQVAAYSLAVLYLRGEAVPKNIPRAVALLKRALGSYDMITAYYLLATVYGRGYLGRPDYQNAVDALQSVPPNYWTSPPRERRPDLSLLSLLSPVEYLVCAGWKKRTLGVAAQARL